MTLLEDIQNSAIDAKSDLATFLRKCKLLAARLGSQPLQDWLIWESNGYPESVTVPQCRVWSLEVFGNFLGVLAVTTRMFLFLSTRSRYISDDVKKSYQHYECRESVASIEAALKEADKGNIQVRTGDLALGIGTKLYVGYNCGQAWAEFGTGCYIELLNSVRNRILDFALALGKEAPEAGEIGSAAATTPEAKTVTQIFNTTVHGGSANLVGTATASSIVFNIGPKDFSALERVLVEHGVPKTEIGELRDALNVDPAPSAPGKFGPKVSAWIGKMMGKAAQGGWNIGIGAAGDLLAQAIAKYYGL